MFVLIVEKDKNPVLKRIPNRLYTLREIVNNETLEVIKYKDVLIVYDDDAFKKLLPINRKIRRIQYKRNIYNYRKWWKKYGF